MKRSTSHRSSVTPKSSRTKNRHQQQQQQPPLLGSPSLDMGEVMTGNFGGSGAWAGSSLGMEQAEEAERLQSVRSARQKRTKPQDWISMTFHQYRLMNVVGSGTFGDVYKGERNSDGKAVALKCIKQEPDGKGFPVTALREMRILRQLRHENIVDLIEVIVDGNPTGGRLSTVALVFEYLDHDLSGLLDTTEAASLLTPALAKSFMLQLIEGVAYMHSKQIIHRDLKGANLLISNTGYLKIADWGLARRLYEMQERYTTKVITLWYRPPELLLRAPLYGPAVDMWSVGCIVAELLTKSSLFPGKNESDQLGLIFDTVGTPTSQNWPGWTELPDADNWRQTVRNSPRPNKLRARFLQFGGEDALELLEGLLTLDPSMRLTAREALECRYFQARPPPTKPGSVKLNLHACHEYEAKRRNGKKHPPKGTHHAVAGGVQPRDGRRNSVSKSTFKGGSSGTIPNQQHQQLQQQGQQRSSSGAAHSAQRQQKQQQASLQISLPQSGLLSTQTRQQHQSGSGASRGEWT